MDRPPGSSAADGSFLEAEDGAGRGRVFPIVEVFGYDAHANTNAALDARRDESCPFAGGKCEKHRQYGFAYCSVSYAAADDSGAARTYAVCDHRMDGSPVLHALRDARGNDLSDIQIVPEVQIDAPKMSFDYVAFLRRDPQQVVVIETQAIDLRGGGVGPAFRAWQEGRAHEWRAYFTEEALRKNRRDTVDYGVNMANVYKRIGTQIAVKGSYLESIQVPL